MSSSKVKHQPRDGETFEEAVERRRQSRMAVVDGYPAELCELVHEYGLNVVQAFVQHKIGTPRIMRHLIDTVLSELSPVRGSSSHQGPAHRRFPVPKGYVLAPEEPTEEMIQASVKTLADWRDTLTADERLIYGRIIDGKLRMYMPLNLKHRARYVAMLAARPGAHP